MANPLQIADSVFTVIATFEVSLPAKRVAILAIIRNRGAPGGCPTCNLKAASINSPQSQKLTVGSRVRRYTPVEKINTNHPVRLFHQRQFPHIESIKELYLINLMSKERKKNLYAFKYHSN